MGLLSYAHQIEPAKSSSQPLKCQCLHLRNREAALESLAPKAISITVMCEELCTSNTGAYELYKWSVCNDGLVLIALKWIIPIFVCIH